MDDAVTWAMVLPVMMREHAQRCLTSINPSYWSRLLIVDNSPGHDAMKPRVSNPIVVHPARNLGCGRSWNLGARWVVDRGLDYLVICSEAVTFHGGMHELVRCMREHPTEPIISTRFGWKLLAIHRTTFEAVGFFDEGFWPAYYEDTDFLYRMGLAGLPSPRENGQAFRYCDVSGRMLPDGHVLTSGLVQIDLDRLRTRYRRKWGGDQGKERFTVPWDGRRTGKTHKAVKFEHLPGFPVEEPPAR
jgi:hypothetical protein